MVMTLKSKEVLEEIYDNNLVSQFIRGANGVGMSVNGMIIDDDLKCTT